MRKLGDTDVFNKTVALRVDLNVPVKDGKVLDDTRILAITQTLNYLKQQKSKIVLISHFGRPEPGIHDEKLSLFPVAKRLEEIFNTQVPLFKTLKDVNFDNDISLVENVRFLSGEVDNDSDLSSQLSDLADVYIFDAFGTSHRAHASTFGAINSSDASCAGLLLEEETNALIKAMDSKETLTLSIVGGSKVSSKLEVIKSLLHVSNEVLTGGGITNTFLKASGNNIGTSLYEDSMMEHAKDLLATKKILLPEEVVVSKSIESSESRVCSVDAVQDDEMILCLLYTSPSPRDGLLSRMPSSA